MRDEWLTKRDFYIQGINPVVTAIDYDAERRALQARILSDMFNQASERLFMWRGEEDNHRLLLCEEDA